MARDPFLSILDSLHLCELTIRATCYFDSLAALLVAIWPCDIFCEKYR